MQRQKPKNVSRVPCLGPKVSNTHCAWIPRLKKYETPSIVSILNLITAVIRKPNFKAEGEARLKVRRLVPIIKGLFGYGSFR